MKTFTCLKISCAILGVILLHLIPGVAWSQSKLKISEFSLFGGNANVPEKGVVINSSITISGGAVGSYSQIRSTGSAFIGGSLHSGGTIKLTNSNTVKGRISAGNSLGLGGNIVEIGSNAVLSGNIDVKGNILVGGGIVDGTVTHPPGTNYIGPKPKGGDLKATPQIPEMPDMPQITSFKNAGTKLVNNTGKISPGVFGKMSLTGNKTVTFSEPGTYEFTAIKNSGTTNNFIFDFQKNPSGAFRIYVHGDIDLSKISTKIINGGAEAQIYTETHGDGRTSPTGKDAFTIANGSTGTTTKWAGMVWAPYASINIGSGTGGSDVTGALWSNFNIVLQSGVKVNFASSSDLPIIPATPPPPGGKYENIIGSELNSLFLKGGVTDSLSKNVFILDGQNVYIEVIARIGQYQTLLALLRTPEYGLTAEISNGPNSLIITGKYPVANLRKLDLLPNLIDYVRPLFPPVGSSGVAYSKGDVSMHTDFMRNGYNVDGEGVRVGVLSDSYNTIAGNPAQTDIANGDLPGAENPVNKTPVKVLKDYPFGRRSDEGRAMLQIVHDVAPRASLAFRTGFISAGDLAVGIRELQQDNCKVIVDDITFITEPYFQDGVVAKAVDDVTALGVSYFSSAGNYGNKSYHSVFTPVAAPAGLTGSAHNFGGGDIFQNISLAPGSYTIVLQWTDGIYSLGQSPAGTLNDLDIYLTDNNGVTLFGFNRNNIGGDPIEILSFTATQSTTTNILITRASGTQNVNFKYIIFRGEGIINEHNAGTSTIVGQANAAGAMAVGAVLYTNSPAFGGTPSMASFSSTGGTPVNGVIRNKPDFAAPNGVNTTVFLGGVNIDGDSFPNFFGTSAAAPHAAAAAALLIQASQKYSGTDLSSSQVRNLLSASAIDILPAGTDRASGSGFIQPEASLRTFASPKPFISELILPNTTTKPGAQEFTLTVKGDFLDTDSKVMLRNEVLTTTYVNSTTLTAVVPAFGLGNPAIFVNTPATSVLKNDGGNSDTLFFFSTVKKKIVVKADDKSKKYGEALPSFTISVTVDGLPLQSTDYSLADLGLDSISFITPAHNLINTGVYFIRPVMRALNPNDPTDANLIETNTYTFTDGLLTIEKLPLKITARDTTITYGSKIGNFNFKYEYNEDNIAVTDRSTLLASINTGYRQNLADAIALVDAKVLVNSRALVNADLENLTFLVSARALINARQLINAKALVNNVPVLTNVVDVAVKSIFNYQEDPQNATLVSAKQLVNARALINAKALINGTATVNARQLVNNSPIVNSETIDSQNNEVVVIVDSLDFTAPPGDVLTEFKSITLVTGITAGQFAVVPGALLSENFEITYGLGKLTILPVPLKIQAENKLILKGAQLPVFTSIIKGYQYDDSLTVSSGPKYTVNPTYNFQAGVYAINPSGLTFNPANSSYTLEYLPGKLYVNPIGPGTRKVKPFLECVELLVNHPSGFKYAAHFSYENPNSTIVFIPVGVDNKLTGAGKFSGSLPTEFLPAGGKFTIYFDGSKLTWTVRSYEVNQKSSEASIASSTSSRCNFESLTNNLYQTLDGTYLGRDHADGTSAFESERVTMFPNPVSDILTVQWKDISDNEVSIVDLSGRSYQPNNIRKPSNDRLELNISNLETGLYLITVKGEAGYKVLRIIKM